jgi:DNA-binding beta-propeller fold protein YncE
LLVLAGFGAAATVASADLAVTDCVSDTAVSPADCRAVVPGMTDPRQIGVSPDGESVYVLAGYQAKKLFLFERTDRGLAPGGCIADDDLESPGCAQVSPGLYGASSIAVSPDGDSVYVGSAEESTVAVFARDSDTGALEPGGCIGDTAASDPCDTVIPGLEHVTSIAASPDGRSVYASSRSFDQHVGHTTGGAIVRFDRAADGALTPAGCVADDDIPAGPCSATAPGLAGVTDLAISGDGTSLYAVSPGDLDGEDSLVHLQRDPATGALTPIGCYGSDCSSPLAAYYKRDVSLSPDGAQVYLAASRQVEILTRSPSSGGLIDQGCIGDPGYGCSTPLQDPGDLRAPEISAARPLQAYVVGHEVIHAFHRDPQTGALGLTGSSRSDRYRFLTLSPDGESLYATSQFTGTLTVLTDTGPGPRPPPADDPPDTKLKRVRGKGGVTVAFELESTVSGSSFECSLDGADWQACGPRVNTRRLEAGRHRIAARGKSPAGAVDPTPAHKRFRVFAD